MFNAIRQACTAIKNMFAAPAVKEVVAVPAIAGDVLTMSSREIAELCGKDHFNVMRDVRTMLDELGEDAFKFEGIYLDAYNREKPCFNLPKDLTLTLVAGYNVRLRHAIIKRWEQLEQNAITRTPALTQEQMTEGLTVA